jgi:hypothetical protein
MRVFNFILNFCTLKVHYRPNRNPLTKANSERLKFLNASEPKRFHSVLRYQIGSMEGVRERAARRNYHRTQRWEGRLTVESQQLGRQPTRQNAPPSLEFLQPSRWNCSAGCAQGFYPAKASLSIGGTHISTYTVHPIIMHAVGAALTHNIHRGALCWRSLLKPST